jgi:hypothetical protein
MSEFIVADGSVGLGLGTITNLPQDVMVSAASENAMASPALGILRF